MAVGEHKHRAPPSVACAVITVSDTRTSETDDSGALVRELLEGAGHTIAGHVIVSDDVEAIQDSLRAFAADPTVDCVVLNGGTGVSPRDNTVEAVTPLFERRLDGFGELFRALSYEEIGSAAMLSRATAGLVGGTAVFALPGSKGGCRLATQKLIVPELGHIASLANPEKWRRE